MATNPLVAVAALHVFLARHSELGDLPIEWSFRPKDGITAYMPGRNPDAAKVADLLAALLDGQTTGNEYVTPDGDRVLPRYVTAQLEGVPFFFSALIDVGGAA